MRCPSCEYPLWNLVPGPCPECGRPFRSDEFEFDPGSVAFLCAKCGQEYFGTDAKGLLLPRAFACVRCGAACDCGEMAVAPTDRIDPLADRNPLPWLDRATGESGRRRRGFFNRFFATFWAFTARGWRAADAVPKSAPTGTAWVFAAIVASLAATLQFAPLALFPAMSVLRLTGAAGSGAGIDIVLWVAGILLGILLIATGVTLVTSGLWALLSHGILRLTGPTEGGLGRTVQSFLYPSAVQLWGGLPFCCLAGVASYVWWIVLCCGTVKRMQGVSWGRACLATLLPGVPMLGILPALLLFAPLGLATPVLPPPGAINAPVTETSTSTDAEADATGNGAETLDDSIDE